jgi:hypothetical protein
MLFFGNAVQVFYALDVDFIANDGWRGVNSVIQCIRRQHLKCI